MLNIVFNKKERCEIVLLGEIARVQTGLVLIRKKAAIEYEMKARYRLLSLKNIREDGMIDNDSFEDFISNEDLDQHYFTKAGDVLMRLNKPFTAVYIDQEYAGLLVPSYFAIIKVDQTKALPEYVAWYLNTTTVKRELERTQAGSRIPVTNQGAIRKIPISLLPIAKQQALVELYRRHQREKMLYEQLIREKELFFQGVAQRLLQGAE